LTKYNAKQDGIYALSNTNGTYRSNSQVTALCSTSKRT